MITHATAHNLARALLLTLFALPLLIATPAQADGHDDSGDPQPQSQPADATDATFRPILDAMQQAYREADLEPMLPHLESTEHAPTPEMFARLADSAFGRFFAESAALLPRVDALPAGATEFALQFQQVGGRRLRATFDLSFYRAVTDSDADGNPLAFSEQWYLGDFDATLGAPALERYETSLTRLFTEPDYEEPAELRDQAALDLDPMVFIQRDDSDLGALLHFYLLALWDDDDATTLAMLWQDADTRALADVRRLKPLMVVAKVLEVVNWFPRTLSGFPARMNGLHVRIAGYNDRWRDGKLTRWELDAAFAREFSDWYVLSLRAGAGRHLDSEPDGQAFAFTP